MLSFLKTLFEELIDFVFPKRKDEEIVNLINYEKISKFTISKEFKNKNINSLLSYKAPDVKSLIWEIKYHQNKKAINFASNLLFEMIKEDVLEKSLWNKDKFVIVNIPITKNKLKEKGFCHTKLLSENIANLFSQEEFLKDKVFYNPNILVKTKETKSQSHTKNKQERLENLKNCFEVNETYRENVHIILIDDVVTTEATLSEAMKTLQKAGFQKITAYTIAS